MDEREQRTAFETWVASPPHEQNTARYQSEDAPWPGQYVNYNVQLAWEAWHTAMRTPNKETDALNGGK